MSALQKLQEKIQEWKRDHEALITLNENLKNQIAEMSASQKASESVTLELAESQEHCKRLEEEVASLKRELEEKDAEIEKIVAQVEALLS